MTSQEPRQAQPWSRGVIGYVLAIALLAVVAVLASWKLVGPPHDLVALGTLLVLAVISVAVQERDVGSRVAFSFLSIIVIASVVLTGPVGSALIGPLPQLFERRRQLVARVFNGGMTSIQGAVGGLVYVRIGGATDLTAVDGPLALLLQVGLPLMVADVAQMLVNALLLSGVVRLSSGVPPRRFLVQMVTSSGIAYIGYGFIGFLFVVLWVPADVGPFSAVLIVAPLMVARWAFVQFGEEQRAHERALSALVTAVETKDPYASGHSGRIATLAEWMAEPLSLGVQEVQALRYAAMLHDVGKVGVPTRLLRRPRELTAEDVSALERHPELGVDLVRDIDFLATSLDGIRHHHERWDGLGYPDGLAGAAIPLVSRVVAVADAFDALTTPRPERPALTALEALGEIERRAGRQFDPAVVAALATVVERHPWPTPQVDDLEAMRGYVDHDDPVVWERLRGLPGPARAGEEPTVTPSEPAPTPAAAVTPMPTQPRSVVARTARSAVPEEAARS